MSKIHSESHLQQELADKAGEKVVINMSKIHSESHLQLSSIGLSILCSCNQYVKDTF